jgi:glucose/arabinose dehydrogenase
MPRALPAVLAVAALVAVLLAARPVRAAAPDAIELALLPRLTGFTGPVGLANAGDGSGRLFVVEQRGKVRVISVAGTLSPTVYLDLTDRIATGGERGLLSLAFHPDFETNHELYAAYTISDGSLRVSQFEAAGADAASVDTSTETVLLTIAHPGQANHNGGQIAFGPDGFLYIGTGDGGGSGDPGGNAQDRTSLLGKILRIDVDHTSGGRQYAIPAENPYAQDNSFRREIYHFGLRNPWRFSFDRAYDNLWIADVGQSAREEVDRVPVENRGQNFGWDCREANVDTSSSYGGSYCDGRTFTRPLAAYRTGVADRCSVIGGYVYRGRTYADLITGMYVYGDFCSGELFGITHPRGDEYTSAKYGDSTAQLTAFGETEAGELYALGLSGTLYRVIARRR